MDLCRLTSVCIFLATAGMVMGAAGAAEEAGGASEGAFLTDYSKLEAAGDNPYEEIYLAPDAATRLVNYSAVMIDQPEMFIHPGSSYKGIKPDDMKLIADALREAVAAEVQGAYKIVDTPGPGVLYLRLAVGDLMLQKKRRPILAYTPVGAVVYAAKKAASEVTDRISLRNMKVEGELLDSSSHEQLSAFTASRGSLSSVPTQEVSWEELTDLFATIGKRLRCRLDNARLPEAQWQKCGAIGLAPAARAGAKE